MRDRLRRIDVGQLDTLGVGDPNHGSAVGSGLERLGHHHRDRLPEEGDSADVVGKLHAAEVGEDA